MNTPIRIGISTCLLGYRVRYDGDHCLDTILRYNLGELIEWIPVCPEIECGFPVPREPMILSGDPKKPRLITRYSGRDYTEMFMEWIVVKTDELAGSELSGFIFKSRSPSCGLGDTKIYTPTGEIVRGNGLFADSFRKRFPFIPVQNSEYLYERSKMVSFFRSVIVYKKWKEFLSKGLVKGPQGLQGPLPFKMT